jgi:hypothetical protein
METHTAADALRNQLKGLLSELDEEIRTTYPSSCAELSRRTDVSEVSIVKDVVCLVRRALLGDAVVSDPRCTSSGQSSDLRDCLAVCARDVRLERERREADLAALRILSWPQQLGGAFQQLLDEEENVCEHLNAQTAFARERAMALKAVISDISEVCLNAISAAMRLSNADEKERRRIAAVANSAAESAAAQWLEWTEACRQKQARHWASCPTVRIPQLLSEASSQDRQAGAFLSAIRTAMKLRRQQIRLVAVQQRLAAVLASCDVLSSLQQSIQLPA